MTRQEAEEAAKKNADATQHPQVIFETMVGWETCPLAEASGVHFPRPFHPVSTKGTMASKERDAFAWKALVDVEREPAWLYHEKDGTQTIQCDRALLTFAIKEIETLDRKQDDLRAQRDALRSENTKLKDSFKRCDCGRMMVCECPWCAKDQEGE